jgi:hypothetical protein
MDLETYLAAQSGDVLWKALRCNSVHPAANELVLHPELVSSIHSGAGLMREHRLPATIR